MLGTPIENRLRSAGLTGPPPDLRERVIACSVPRLRPGTTWAEQIWFSGRWRLAALALLFTVFAFDALDRIPLGPGSSFADRPGPVAMETAQAAGEAARQAGLPGDVAALLERQALLAASQPAQNGRVSIDGQVTLPDGGELENR